MLEADLGRLHPLFAALDTDPYQNLSPQEIISKELRIKRQERIPVSSLLLEDSLTDPVHVENLAQSMSGDRGQISPITVRARIAEGGQIVYDVIDGFHRGQGLRILEEKDGHALMADAVVVYGCSDEELYDLRVLAANSVSSVKFARMAEWMHSAFRSARWQNERVPHLIASGRLSIAQVFSLASTGSSGVILGLTTLETEELKLWAGNKSRIWNRPLGTLAVELRTVEIADPELVKQVRKGQGTREGKGVLTHARLKAIADNLPYEYPLQRQLANLALNHNLVASEIGKIASRIAEAKDHRDFPLIDDILRSPFDHLAIEDIEMNPEDKTIPRESKRATRKRRKTSPKASDEDPDSELDSLRLDEIIRVQDALIAVLARRANLTYQNPKAVEALVGLLEYKLRVLDHGDKNYDPRVPLNGSGIIFDSLAGVVSNTAKGTLVELSEKETELLWILVLFQGKPVTKEAVGILMGDEIDLGATVPLLQWKLDKAARGVGKQLIGDPRSGYLWKNSSK